MKWRLALSAVLLLAWSALACGQVTVNYEGLKDSYEQDEPIVFEIEAGEGIPEGAKIRGGITGADLTALQVTPNVYHVWAKSGKRTIKLSLVWVLTRDVTIGEETFPVLVDFGQYEDEQEFTVAGGGDDPPPPPPPSGNQRIWFAVEAARRDNLPSYANSLAFRQQLESLGHDYAETVFRSQLTSTQVPERLSRVAQAVREAALPYPVVVLEPLEGGGTIKVIALPSSADEFLEVLK